MGDDWRDCKDTGAESVGYGGGDWRDCRDTGTESVAYRECLEGL